MEWTVADLDADEIRQTVVEAVAAKRLADGTPTQAAVVLFGTNPLPQFPQCEIPLARGSPARLLREWR